jgi:hypothetical protein
MRGSNGANETHRRELVLDGGPDEWASPIGSGNGRRHL